MDLKQIMQELHYGAQHFSREEKRFFDGVWAGFSRSGIIAESHAPHILELYRKIKFRQLDMNAILAELEANTLLLAESEQTKVEGARMSLELLGQLDNVTIEAILKVRKAFLDRQHNTIAGRGELATPRPQAPRVAAAPQQMPRALPAMSALDAAAKLLKKGR